MSLVSENEPQPVEIISPSGNSGFVFTCEHAGHSIPRCLGDLGLTDEQLKTDVVCDIGAADVTRHLCKKTGAAGILSGYSRLIIDCNRNPGHPASIPEISQRGFPVPGNTNLTPPQKTERENTFFWPYQRAVEQTINTFIQKNKTPPVVISIHSFAPEYHGVLRKWHIGVLWNKDRTIAGRLIDVLSQDTTIIVGNNEPYTAQDDVGFGYTLNTYAESKGYPHVLLEIRQDLINTTEKAAIWAEKIAAALEEL